MLPARTLRVALLALLWGSGFLWTKLALESLTPAQVVVARLLLGALVLVGFLYAFGGRLPSSRRTWAHLTVAAVFGNVLPYFLFSVGLQQVDSAVGGMLNATTPVWTVLVTVLASRANTLETSQVLGVAVGLAGTILIFAPWASDTQFMTAGALACLGGALCYAISYVYIARFLTRDGTDPLTLSAGQLVAASITSLLILLPLGTVQPSEWRAVPIASVIVLGTLGTGLAYVINYRIITDDGAVAAAAVIFLLPIVAILAGVAFLQEQVTAQALVGVAIVLLGVALTRRGRRHPTTVEQGKP